MLNIFTRQYAISLTIILYMFIYSIINYFKPNLIYTDSGLLRQFGLGQSKKTVIPLWIASISIAILSYVCVLYLITLNNIHI